MNLRSRMKSHPELHAGALNDILFILLLFFLIVSTLANPNVIKLSVPKGVSNTKAKQTVVVSINQNKQYYVGRTPVSFDRLKEALIPVLSNETLDPTIVINADKSVPVEEIVNVMEIARELKVRTVLATKKP